MRLFRQTYRIININEHEIIQTNIQNNKHTYNMRLYRQTYRIINIDEYEIIQTNTDKL